MLGKGLPHDVRKYRPLLIEENRRAYRIRFWVFLSFDRQPLPSRFLMTCLEQRPGRNIDTRPEPQSPWIDRTHIGLGIKPHRIGIKNKLLLPGTITLTGSVGQTL